jgi:hypothetical protein
MSSLPSTVAARFARALDVEDYRSLASLLSADCQYFAPKGRIVGLEAIVASYREASNWAKENIHSVRYESDVRVHPKGNAVVTFLDHLEHEGLKHIYACEQAVIVAVEGKIHRIVHHDIPGQREATDAFLKRVGVKQNARSPPAMNS